MTIKKISSILVFCGATLCAASGAEVVPLTNASPSGISNQLSRPKTTATNFTEEQTKAYHQALESSREQMSSLAQKIRVSRRELEELVKAEKLDENAIRAKAAQIGQAEGDLALGKAKILGQLRPLFSPEQLDRLARAPQMNGAPYTPAETTRN